MTVEQVSGILNELATEQLGEGVVSTVNYDNMVDVGRTLADAMGVDNYVNKISDKIGKSIVSIRKYEGVAPSIFRDKWDYGNILEEIILDMPTAVDNSTWKLEDNHDYSAEEHTFVRPGASVKYYNNKTTYRLRTASIAKRQVMDSMKSPETMVGFFSGIQMAYENQKAVFNEALVMSTINNMIGETLADNNANRVVKVLTMYNAATGSTLTADKALTDPEFIRYTNRLLNLYAVRMKKLSVLYNIQGIPRHTPKEFLHTILHQEYVSSAQSYLYSDTFNRDDVTLSLGTVETVPYWQGSGTDYSWASTSKIDVTTASGQSVAQGNILGIMFDDKACAVCNTDTYESASFTASANFTNYFYFVDESHLNNLSQNFVVFLLA